MKNVTVTMDEEVAKWAKIKAAKMDMSLSRMLGETLREQMRSEHGYDQAMARFFSKRPLAFKAESETYPGREALYER